MSDDELDDDLIQDLEEDLDILNEEIEPDLSQASQPSPTAKPRFNLAANKQFILKIAGAIAVVVGIAYFAMDNKGASNLAVAPSKAAVPAPVIETVATQPEPTPTNTQASDFAASFAPESSVDSKAIEEERKIATANVQQSLDNLTTDSMEQRNSINQINVNLQELTQSLQQLNHALRNVDHRINSLQQRFESLTQDLSKVKRTIRDEDLDLIPPPPPEPAQSTAATPLEPEYIIHAIIPGRAWLKSKKGQIITVAEGDTLGDYGKIASIDPNASVVRTSSGIVFR